MANIKISELSPLVTVQDADVLPIVDNAVTKKVTAAILRSYTQGNSVLLTGAQTVAGIKTFTSQIASSVATGTAPFSVASTTKVTNLNADLLDGLSSADFQAPLSGTGIVKSTAGTISYLTDNSTNWNTAFNDKINSAAVTGSGTNTLTLTQQDAGTITATWVNGTLIREIRNNTGATLTKGTIVYISGATGNKPTVSKAIATGDSTSAQTFGFVQENILNNANGYVVVIGDLTGVDTSAFAEGAQLYLSATTAGTFTDVKQYAPAHLVYVGIVTRSHPTLGQIEVNIQNGYEMDELHNVSAQNPSNGDILQFVTSTGLWTKVAGTTTNISEGTNLYFTNARSRSAISLTTTGTSGAATYNSTTGVLNVPNYADTDTGITSLNGLTALTQTFAVGTSGTDFGISSATSTHTFNLPTASAANRGALSSADWTTFNNKQNALTNPITGTGTTNYLPKFTGASALGNSTISDNGSIAFIEGNLQIENASPTLTIKRNSGDYPTINFAAGATLFGSIISNSSSGEQKYSIGPTVGWGGYHTFFTNTVERMRITSAGNVLIGTTTDAGYKLDVNGTARVSGSLTAGASSVIGNQLTLNALYANGIEFINTNVGVDNRNFRIISDQSVYGDFQIQRSTTQGGSTYANLLSFAQSGAATFSSTLNAKAGSYINGASNSDWGFSVENTGTTSAHGLYVNIGSSSTGIPFRVDKGGSSLFSIANSGAATFSSSVTATSFVANNRTILSSGGVFDNATNGNDIGFGFGAGIIVSTNGVGIYTAQSLGNATYPWASATFSSSVNTGADATINGITVGRGAGNVASNTAVGVEAAFSNTSGANNVSFGLASLYSNTTGSANIAIGVAALSSNTTGGSNSVLGTNAQSGNYDASVILGRDATATASNQFVAGSAAYPAGAVATEVNASTKVWNVRINGVAQKILLA